MKQSSRKSIRRPLAGRTVLCSLFSVLSAFAAFGVHAEGDKGWSIGGGATLDFTSKQLTYGLIDNPHAIVTPSVELSIANEEWFTLTFSVDAIFDTTNYGAKDGGYADRRWKYQELTPGITLSKNWDTTEFLGSTLDTSINYTYEYHPPSSASPTSGSSRPSRWNTSSSARALRVRKPARAVSTPPSPWPTISTSAPTASAWRRAC